uniref:RNA-directed RNA polymerase n=1 Tax=Riboviria sp. TaxID=2585031 RepID=A0A8K1WQM6_9VIRU|nr:MAG: hypothetical protein 1 [Riboviria sp.]
MFDAMFSRLLRTLEPTSSTGLGKFRKYATIGDALGWDGVSFSEVCRVEDLKQTVLRKLRSYADSIPGESWAVDLGTGEINPKLFELAAEAAMEGEQEVADDIKVFIKDEPHKITKLTTNRYRLISCLSLEDQMVDRILFYPWVKAEVVAVDAVTAKAGWSPLPDGYKALEYQFPEEQALAVDKTAWDWTMPSWVVKAYFAIKMRQVREASREYQWICLRRIMDVVGPNAIFRLPSGERLQQQLWGLMKSGWYLTLSLNSMAQLCQHILAWERLNLPYELPLVWAMGDDIIARWRGPQWLLPIYQHNLAMTGCIVKHVIIDRQFAGFRFGDGTVTPLYKGKHQFTLRHLDPKNEVETILSYATLYALSADDWLRPYYSKCGATKANLRDWAMGLMPLSFDVPVEFRMWID